MPATTPSTIGIRTALGVIALALTAGCGSDDKPSPARPPASPPASTISVSDGTRLAPSLAGTWRALGNGAYVQISQDAIRTYHETASYCIADPTTESAKNYAGFTAVGDPTQPGGRVDIFAVPSAPPAFRLQRVAALPAACTASPPTDAQASAQGMCETMEQLYPFFRERGIDWTARCAQLKQAAAQARSESELSAALVQALRGFNDAHVTLEDAVKGEEIFSSWTSTHMKMLQERFAAQDEVDDFEDFVEAWAEHVGAEVATRLTERHEALGGAVIWGRLPGNVGYLSITQMGMYGHEDGVLTDIRRVGEELDRVVAALQDTRAMIVDVAFNQGGYDLVSAAIAARFADTSRLAFTSQTRETERQAPLRWTIAPAGARQYLKPVYLLTSDYTVSAGETFTLMMRAFPHVRQVGQRTAGAVSDMQTKPLPGKYRLTLPNQIVLDPNGTLFEVAGIAPHVPVTLFDPARPESLENGHAAALDAVLALIGK